MTSTDALAEPARPDGDTDRWADELAAAVEQVEPADEAEERAKAWLLEVLGGET